MLLLTARSFPNGQVNSNSSFDKYSPIGKVTGKSSFDLGICLGVGVPFVTLPCASSISKPNFAIYPHPPTPLELSPSSYSPEFLHSYYNLLHNPNLNQPQNILRNSQVQPQNPIDFHQVLHEEPLFSTVNNKFYQKEPVNLTILSLGMPKPSIMIHESHLIANPHSFISPSDAIESKKSGHLSNGFGLTTELGLNTSEPSTHLSEYMRYPRIYTSALTAHHTPRSGSVFNNVTEKDHRTFIQRKNSIAKARKRYLQRQKGLLIDDYLNERIPGPSKSIEEQNQFICGVENESHQVEKNEKTSCQGLNFIKSHLKVKMKKSSICRQVEIESHLEPNLNQKRSSIPRFSASPPIQMFKVGLFHNQIFYLSLSIDYRKIINYTTYTQELLRNILYNN
ncbi:unnamed protein product [Protopolystoma xenopodis]|uniref:Uncharacterized protein n=1 Tax=Protopolystoma xenopodis TaxID=117903 RepID=A0A448WIC3_9PLAT|nr:unnamed protein product [Protopolystoma xenopodis]